ncbi:MAG: serine hydrolase domain-containing protein [Ilumatobacteraceae bacterium]
MTTTTAALEAELDDLFARPAEEGVSLAFVLLRGGELVAERYGVAPGNLFAPDDVAVTAETPLISWSTAKSMVHAAIGILVGDGLLDTADPAPVPSWSGTEKAAITVLDLLEMRPGLRFVEDYLDGETSDVIDMLFGSGAGDHAAYAAAMPLDHPPGTMWNYSSGTTNILCRILGDVIGGGPAEVRAFLDQRLFGPAGMFDAEPTFDAAGTWVGSSYVHAPARQFARFGELYRLDGVAGDQRVLPEGWLDHARTTIAHDPESGFGYGRHWWTWPDQPGSVAAHGYEGQYIIVLPQHDAVLVHLGKTDAAVRDRLVTRLRRIISTL